MVGSTDSCYDAVNNWYFGLRAWNEAANVRQEDACCYLSNISTLSTHVGSCYNLEVAVAFHHITVVCDALSRVLHLDKRMAGIDQSDLGVWFFFRTQDGLNILVVSGDLCERGKHIELTDDDADSLEKRVVG
jgi:hypothetical protein